MRELAIPAPAVTTTKPIEPQPVATFTAADFEHVLYSHARNAIKVFLNVPGAKTVSKSNPYQVKVSKSGRRELLFTRAKWKNGVKGKRTSLCAAEINGVHFGNATEIYAGGRRRSQQTGWAKELQIQRALTRIIPMIPFNLFRESKLDVNALRVIEKGVAESIDFGRKDKEDRTVLTHFTGALVFEIQGQYYLFDLDRNEIKHQTYNAFMSKLPRPVTSIADAYASLKPVEVSEAEKFLGHEVQRQGEWFFIPVQGNFEPGAPKEFKTTYIGWSTNRREVVVLESSGANKRNRPHYVEEICPEGYVRGRVNHGGREHKEITLKTWCKPVPNTAVESFKISGMVD